ncbi:MAG: KTSC domain-containing protein [Chloroflexi bacterium]|nr:KTSC domain-containing protein [Chloroflexota bacterium]
MPNSPLFKNAGRAIQQQATKAFKSTAFGQLIGEADRVRRHPGRKTEKFSKLLDRHKGMNPKRLLKEAMGATFGDVLAEVEHYSSGSGRDKKIINDFLASLGPAGKILRSLVGATKSGGMAATLTGAQRILEAFGFEILPQKHKWKTQPVGRAVEAAQEFLEELGFTVLKPEEESSDRGRGRLPFGISETTRAGTQRKHIPLPMASGRNRQFPPDHPIVTGEMVKADSSNVWEYGYDIENAYLYMRFKYQHPTTGQKMNGPGSLYRYMNVEPEMFLRLHKASSKGKWLWKEIRTDTHSGHLKSYELVGITGGYVPRMAVARSTGEYFEPRTIRTIGGKWLTSQKPKIQVSRGTLSPLPVRGVSHPY